MVHTIKIVLMDITVSTGVYELQLFQIHYCMILELYIVF